MTAGKRWSRETGWVDADIDPIEVKATGPTPARVCEDCTEGTPHYEGSVDDVPLWKPGERKAYGAFAEVIEMEDELRHAFD
jgi:hypothetical protein